jgi:hypothetical protein
MKQSISLVAFGILYGLMSMGCGSAIDDSSQQPGQPPSPTDSSSAGIISPEPSSEDVSTDDVETSAKRCVVSCGAVNISTGAACDPVRGSARTAFLGGCKKACQWATESAEGQAAQSGCRVTTCSEQCH